MSGAIKIGIMAALPDEVKGLADIMDTSVSVSQFPAPDIMKCEYQGLEIYLGLSGIGKVAAAITATTLIQQCGISELLFTGVAGGLHNGINVGDVVVGTTCLQHDLDVSPLFPPNHIPGLGLTDIDTFRPNNECLVGAVRDGLKEMALNYPDALSAFAIKNSNVHLGQIISGDQFISEISETMRLKRSYPHALCVEMEGAAVAQACMSFGVTFNLIRTLSDKADESAHVDFPRFAKEVAGRYATFIIRNYLDKKLAN